jgi:hypothetical protein
MASRESDGPSTRTLRDLHSILRRSVWRAQVREEVKRNVVLLCDCPTGKDGRPSKSLTLEQFTDTSSTPWSRAGATAMDRILPTTEA